MLPIRLALIEDDPEVRELLHGYLCRQPEFDCVVVAASVTGFLTQLPALPHPPQVLLLDSGLPGSPGTEALPLLLQLLPQLTIVLHTVFDDADRTYQALCQGASGYLLKNTPLADLKAAVLGIARGGAPISRAVARKVLAHFQRRPAQLTTPEREVLHAVVEGLSDQQVSARLGITLSVMRTHVRLIYKKLAASDNQPKAKASTPK